MPKLTIDGREVEVANGATILQAAEKLGIEIPRFCYHERLAVSGNCRMCLVEVEKMPKLAASCAQPAGEGMVVHTTSPAVRKARQGVMEFLLINHPLDCPICDQGGECDLQDQAMVYGKDRGRYTEAKRSVEGADYGPLVATHMTRCIQCTRCIRFISEVAGTQVLGGLWRGEHMEVTKAVEASLSSELSGNLIDLCPVGALTNKPAANAARCWEYKKTDSIDAMDGLGAAIRVDSRGNEVARILPRVNDDVNEEWLGDRSRFACDGLRRQRLDRCYVRKDGVLQAVPWAQAFAAVAAKISNSQGKRIAAIAGDQADCESMLALKDLMAALDAPHLDCRQDGARLEPSLRASYLFNATVNGIDKADALLMIGTNPRKESPVLNARLRKRWLTGKMKAALVGPQADLTFEHEHLGDNPAVLQQILDGSHPFAKVLKDAEFPLIIIGPAALTREDGGAVLDLTRRLAEAVGAVKDDWNGFSVLHTAAARVGGLDLGFVPRAGGHGVPGIVAAAGNGGLDVLFLLQADEVDMKGLGNTFVVYIGSHGDAGAHRADVVLPAAAYTEKSATYVNMEGRVQRTSLAIFPPGEAKEDWRIVRALSDAVGKPLPYDTVEALRRKMAEVNPVFATLGTVAKAPWGNFGVAGPLLDKPFLPAVDNYYMTDPISRASKTMADCTGAFGGGCGCGGHGHKKGGHAHD